MENAANTPESVTNAFVRALNRQDLEGMLARMPRKCSALK